MRIEDLGKIFEKADADVYQRSMGTSNNRAYDGIVLKGNLPAVVARLKQDGFTNATLLGYGDNAIIVETSPGQLLRFRGPQTSSPNTWEMPDIDQGLNTFYRADVNGCRIEGVPKLRTLAQEVKEGNISSEDANILLSHLRKGARKQQPPCVLYDYIRGNGEYKYEQVGLLPDNTPIIIDRGSVLTIDDYRKCFSQHPRDQKKLASFDRELAELDELTLPSVPAHLGWDGKWLTSDGKRKMDVYTESKGLVVIKHDEPFDPSKQVSRTRL